MNSKLLMPVIHVQSVEQALENINIAYKANSNGVFLIHHSQPFSVFGPMIKEIRRRFRMPFWMGFNALDLSAEDAIKRMPYSYVGVGRGIYGVWSDSMGIVETDTGFDVSQANKVLQALKDKKKFGACSFYGSFAFKYQPKIKNLRQGVMLAREYCDVLVTSGDGTGIAADIDKVRQIYEAIEGRCKLGLASGVTLDNVESYLPYVDVFMVATGISKDEFNLDLEKTRALAEIIHKSS